MEFYKILDSAMTETNTSNYRLAKILNVHPSTIASWRAGITEPKYETILQIEDIFKIAIVHHEDDLECADEENPQKVALLKAFDKLNLDGQQKAIERIEELTEIPKYQR